MEVSCQFPLDYTVTAEYPFLPQISMNIIKFNVTDYGEFSALMQLFDTDEFERPFEGSPEIEEGELLNVGVSLLDVTDPNVRVTLQECWATPESSPGHDLRHDLINDACGVPGVLDNTLDIVSNGDSRMAKWHGSVFKFVGYENVWLHCNIKVCFADQADCVPTCSGRSRRSAEEDDLFRVSVAHPIKFVDFEVEVDNMIDSSADRGEGIITGLVIGVTIITILLFNAIGLIVLRRRKTKLIEMQ